MTPPPAAASPGADVWRAGLWVVAIALAAQLPFHAGWLVDPAGRLLANPFHGVHAWAVDVVGQALRAGDWPDPTAEAGFPLHHRARFVLWPVLVGGGLLRGLVSPILALNLAAWVGPALGGLAFVRLAAALRPEAQPAGLIAGGLAFALSPTTLAAALSGQVENTQAWVLPLLLHALVWAAGRPLRLPAVLALGLAGGLTSPYLGMFAALCAPALLALRPGGRDLALPGAALLLGLALAGRWLDPSAFDPANDLFRPSYGEPGVWPPLWGDPPSVATLQTLLLGQTQPQTRALVVHLPYLGLPLLLGALALSRERRPWLLLVAGGVLLALGPVLGIADGPMLFGQTELHLPAIALRWVHAPLAIGGQYYRALVIAHLGLAGLLTSAPAGRRLLALGLVAGADLLRVLALVGLPWPTVALPTAAWARWAADPQPGAVTHLPFFGPDLIPCHPVRLAGHAVHGRPLTDMPRAWKEPPADPTLERLATCTRAKATCDPPPAAALAAAGLRYAVVDTPEGEERQALVHELNAAWGPPTDRADGLLWWVLQPSR